MAKEFELKPFLKCDDPEMNKYARDFEEWVSKIEASNIKRMIMSIDDVAAIVADDLTSLAESPAGEADLRVLNDEKESKVFERFIALVKMVESFNTVSRISDGLRPKTAEYIDPNKKQAVKISVDENAFERMQEEALKKHGR